MKNAVNLSRFFVKKRDRKVDETKRIILEEQRMEKAYEQLLPAPGERPCKKA